MILMIWIKQMKPKTLRKATMEAALSIAIQYKKLGMAVTPKVRAVINEYKLRRKHDNSRNREYRR